MSKRDLELQFGDIQDGLGSEGGNGEENEGLANEVVGAGQATTPQSQAHGVKEATGRQHTNAIAPAY